VDEAGPDLYENSAKIANRVQALADRGELSPAQANRLRSQVREKLLSPGSDEVSVGRDIMARIYGLIDSAADASPLLRDARAKYAQYMKFKDVTDRLADAKLNQDAAGTGGNANAARQAIKPLIKSRGNQRLLGATPDEKAALRDVASGNKVVRALSAFDPFHSRLGALIQGGLGIKTGGLSAATIPIGMAATAAEKASQARSVQNLLDLIAAGGVQPKAPPVTLFPGNAPPGLPGPAPVPLISYQQAAPLAAMAGLAATPAAASQRRQQRKH
jgi:hypothetical protein